MKCKPKEWQCWYECGGIGTFSDLGNKLAYPPFGMKYNDNNSYYWLL